jgi:hypothetical protein
MAARVVMREASGENEGYRLEAAMRMGSKREPPIVRRIDLRTMMVEEQEWIDLRQAGRWKRAARREISDIVADCAMNGGNRPQRRHHSTPTLP